MFQPSHCIISCAWLSFRYISAKWCLFGPSTTQFHLNLADRPHDPAIVQKYSDHSNLANLTMRSCAPIRTAAVDFHSSNLQGFHCLSIRDGHPLSGRRRIPRVHRHAWHVGRPCEIGDLSSRCVGYHRFADDLFLRVWSRGIQPRA